MLGCTAEGLTHERRCAARPTSGARAQPSTPPSCFPAAHLCLSRHRVQLRLCSLPGLLGGVELSSGLRCARVCVHASACACVRAHPSHVHAPNAAHDAHLRATPLNPNPHTVRRTRAHLRQHITQPCTAATRPHAHAHLECRLAKFHTCAPACTCATASCAHAPAPPRHAAVPPAAPAPGCAPPRRPAAPWPGTAPAPHSARAAWSPWSCHTHRGSTAVIRTRGHASASSCFPLCPRPHIPPNTHSPRPRPSNTHCAPAHRTAPHCAPVHRTTPRTAHHTAHLLGRLRLARHLPQPRLGLLNAAQRLGLARERGLGSILRGAGARAWGARRVGHG